ncbi:MAG TPA: hypothetical protein VJU61_19305 [Polyangiaceae bacterium]|nr:hypothetical protein [Polyangiaceae bacterium]
MKAPTSSLSLALSLALLASCGDPEKSSEELCTLVGCSDGFTVNLVANEPLREGSYDVEVTMDGAPATCRISLPVDLGADPACSDSASLRASATVHNNGAPPDRDVPNAIIVNVLVAADVAVLNVRHDDAPLFEQTYRPSYQTIAPNGPECGPICSSAPSEEATLTYD